MLGDGKVIGLPCKPDDLGLSSYGRDAARMLPLVVACIRRFDFNICGNSGFQCNPTWPASEAVGVAVQYWGNVPTCNITAPACNSTSGQPKCCTQDCEVLGTGIPQWQLKNPANPETGGVLVTHEGVIDRQVPAAAQRRCYGPSYVHNAPN